MQELNVKGKEFKFIACDEAITKELVIILGNMENKQISEPFCISPKTKQFINVLEKQKKEGYTHYFSEGERLDLQKIAVEKGYIVGVITGKSTHDFREHKLKIPKSDENDAIAIAKFLIAKKLGKERSKKIYLWKKLNNEQDELGTLLESWERLKTTMKASNNELWSAERIKGKTIEKLEELSEGVKKELNEIKGQTEEFLINRYPVLYEWLKIEAETSVGPYIVGYLIYYFHPDRFKYINDDSTIHYMSLHPRYDTKGNFQEKGNVKFGTALRQFGGCSQSIKRNGKIIKYSAIVGQLEWRKEGKYYNLFMRLKEEKLKKEKTPSAARAHSCKEVNQAYGINAAHIIQDYFNYMHKELRNG